MWKHHPCMLLPSSIKWICYPHALTFSTTATKYNTYTIHSYLYIYNYTLFANRWGCSHKTDAIEAYKAILFAPSMKASRLSKIGFLSTQATPSLKHRQIGSSAANAEGKVSWKLGVLTAKEIISQMLSKISSV